MSIRELDNIIKCMNYPIKRIFMLTPTQEELLFYSLMNRNSKAFLIHVETEIIGNFNVDLFEKSLEVLSQKHDVLNSRFVFNEINKPRMVVLDKKIDYIFYNEILCEDIDNKELIWKEYKQKDYDEGFDLEKTIPIRIKIVKIDKEKFKFLLSFHHIILDGWSLTIMFKEILNNYCKFKSGDIPKPFKTIKYNNYLKWIEEKKGQYQEAISFWKEYLEGYQPNKIIPQKNQISTGNEYIRKEVKIIISEKDTNSLIEFSKKHRVSFSSTFHCIWGVLFLKYSKLNDIVIGSVVSVRPDEVVKVDEMLGLFINSIPIRIKNKVNNTFLLMVKEFQKNLSQISKYNYISMRDILLDCDFNKKLFDHTLTFENYPLISSEFDVKDLGFKFNKIEMSDHTNFDFGVIVIPDRELTVKISYNPIMYSDDFIFSLKENMNAIVKKVINNENILIDELDLLKNNQ